MTTRTISALPAWLLSRVFLSSPHATPARAGHLHRSCVSGRRVAGAVALLAGPGLCRHFSKARPPTIPSLCQPRVVDSRAGWPVAAVARARRHVAARDRAGWARGALAEIIARLYPGIRITRVGGGHYARGRRTRVQPRQRPAAPHGKNRGRRPFGGGGRGAGGNAVSRRHLRRTAARVPLV